MCVCVCVVYIRVRRGIPTNVRLMDIKYVDIVKGELSSIYVANIVLRYWSIRSVMVAGGDMGVLLY